jgi:phospholipid/cholesterol/gamma-HCH transport system substrate-binding protein
MHYLHYVHRLSRARIHQLVGWFVVVPLLILGAVLFVVGKNEHLFEEKYRISTVFSEGFGVKVGYPVLLLGVQVGKVSDIEFTEQNDARFTLAILKRYQSKIRTDSKAKIEKSGGFIGDPQVEIKPGNKKYPMVPDGGYIESEEPFDLTELKAEADRMVTDIKLKMHRVDEIITDVSTAVDSGKAALNSFGKASDKAFDVLGHVDATVTEVKQQILKEVPAVMKKVHANLDAVGDVMMDVKKSVANLRPAFDDVRQSTRDLSALLHNDVPTLVQSAQTTMTDLNEIVTGAKKTFPISVFAAKGRGTRSDEPIEGAGLRSLRRDELTKE